MLKFKNWNRKLFRKWKKKNWAIENVIREPYAKFQENS